MLVAVGVMVGVYALLMFELMHRTTAAMLGVSVLLFIQFIVGHFVPELRIWESHDPEAITEAHGLFESIIGSVDWNVVFLLFGMMVLVAVTERTGIFQFIALKAYELARGQLRLLVALLLLLTAVASAFLDNVTTMLLMTPITIELCIVLGINPIAFLLPMVFVSNIGGAATLIGDPPNILVGSHAGLTFNDFLIHMGPIALITGVAFCGLIFWMYRKDDAVEVPDVEPTLERLRREYRVEDWKPVRTAGLVMAFVVALFVMHGVLEMEVSLAALIGAGVLLVLSREDVVKVLEDVEWATLIFFVMLFILVGAVEETGFLGAVATWIGDTSGGNVLLLLVLILWVSAIFSAAVDNIPFTATMLPVVSGLVAANPDLAIGAGLWWALVTGADLGGNATLVGASANIVTVGMAERAGYHISFAHFMRKGIPVALVTLTVATVWVVVRYGGVL